MLKHDGSLVVHANVWKFKTTTQQPGETLWVHKPAVFMTNAPGVAKRLRRRCCSASPCGHTHGAIVGQEARNAQRYPRDLW